MYGILPQSNAVFAESGLKSFGEGGSGRSACVGLDWHPNREQKINYARNQNQRVPAGSVVMAEQRYGQYEYQGLKNYYWKHP